MSTVIARVPAQQVDPSDLSAQGNLRPNLSIEPGVRNGETPQERIPLWALVDQVKDVSGEIALAVDMLDSDDPEEAATAVSLLNQFVDAEHSTKAVVYTKADSIAAYVVALERQAKARREAAEEDYQRALARAQRDEARAARLTGYLQLQLRRLEPNAKRFELPNHDVVSRAGSTVVDIENEEDLPPEFFNNPKPPKAKPNLVAIKAALQKGEDVPGARLVQKDRTWSVKR